MTRQNSKKDQSQTHNKTEGVTIGEILEHELNDLWPISVSPKLRIGDPLFYFLLLKLK